jgi:isopenicillin-N N-acyltransferase-like protein
MYLWKKQKTFYHSFEKNMKKISVQGSHYECGRQIGAACQEELSWMVKDAKENPPSSYTWEEMRDRARVFFQITEGNFPWINDENRGAADGAGVDVIDLFASALEELYSTPTIDRCSDFVALPPATNGAIILGHNNDLDPSYQKTLVSVEWHFQDSPSLYSIGPGGIYISVGINSQGIVLTGNDLSQNDEHIGIPRGFIARAILNERNFSGALSVALHPERASSYNNIITCDDGTCVSVEGSGTDYALLYPEKGWLVHTNHYTHPKMRKYESDPEQVKGSMVRYERALELVRDCESPVTMEIMKEFLTDHKSEPSICRHEKDAITVFSTLIDLSGGSVWACLGSPCQNDYEFLWNIRYRE